MESLPPRFYVTGGSLPRDALCYVERRADADLLASLRRGEFCYVLTARQMGKSSLMVRTAARLSQEGTAVAILDPTAVGTNVTPEQWYDGLLVRLGDQLGLQQELESFWLAHERWGPLQRFMSAIQTVVLPALASLPPAPDVAAEKEDCLATAPAPPPQQGRGTEEERRLVIFIDEIDVVRSLPFSTDEFFAAIRECYNRRSQDAQFQRLTFCLLGVATPADLIRDPCTTPFNIGRRIELHDFTFEEASVLAQGLQNGRQAAPLLLKRILYWTGGHPYLTQRLCQRVAEAREGLDARGVDRACRELFLGRGAQERDDNLHLVRERLLHGGAAPAALLDLYARILRGQWVPDDDTDPLANALRLSGITRSVQGRLRVRNRIYQRVFDRRWVVANMPDAELRRQRHAFWRGVARAASVSALILTLMVGLALTAVQKARESRHLLARLDVAQGVQMLNEQDTLGALLWFAEALRLEEGKPQRERVHRCRLGAILGSAPRLLQILFHSGGVNSVEFSPDGRRLVTASQDGSARVWEAGNGRLVSSMIHRGAVRSATFSPDGRSIVTASEMGEVQVWDASGRGPQGPPFRHQAARALHASFSPDGHWVVTASGATEGRASEARIWQVGSSRPLARLRHARWVVWAEFSPDGKRVITASQDGTARIWEWASGMSRELVPGHGDDETGNLRQPPHIRWPMIHATFSPDGRRVAAASLDGIAWVWDAASGKPLVGPLHAARRALRHLAFSPDGQRLATVSGDGTAWIWNATTGKSVAGPLEHPRGVGYACFSPDGRRLATACQDGAVRVWDAVTGDLLLPPLRQVEAVMQVAFDPSGNRLASASADGTVQVWGTAIPPTTILSMSSTYPFFSVAIDSSGRRVVTTSPLGAQLWRAEPGSSEVVRLQQESQVVRAEFGGDDRWLLTLDLEGKVCLWDADSGRSLGVIEDEGSPVTAVAASLDGQRLATGHRDGMLRIWQPATGRPQLLGQFQVGRREVLWVTFSPDAACVFTVVQGGRGQIWESRSGQPVGASLPHRSSNWSPSFSPDGRWVVTAWQNDSAQVWDAKTGRPVGTPLHHFEEILHVAFSPDGERVATASMEGTARVWDRRSGKPLGWPLVHCGQVTHVAFSDDGRVVATAAQDKTARVWEVATGEPVTSLLQHDCEVWRVAFGDGGQQLLTLSWSLPTGRPGGLARFRRWPIAPDPRPLNDLLALAYLFSGRRLHPSGGLLALPVEEKEALWHDLHCRWREQFIPLPVSE